MVPLAPTGTNMYRHVPEEIASRERLDGQKMGGGVLKHPQPEMESSGTPALGR